MIEKKSIKLALTILFSVILFIIFFAFFINFFANYFWFESLKFENRFLKEITIKILLFLISFLIFFVIALLNHLVIKNNILKFPRRITIEEVFSREVNILIFFIFFLFALIFGINFANKWLAILSFLNYSEFKLTDPIFYKDISFYIFKMPIYLFIKSNFIWLIIFNLLYAIILYLVFGLISINLKVIFIPKRIRIHLGFLLFFLLIIYAYSFYLKKFTILWNQHSIVKGANYADVNCKILSYKIMFFTAIIFAFSFLYWALSDKIKHLFIVFTIYLIILLVFNYIYPFIIQKLIVEPNEIEKEKEFINYTIEWTRIAYNLDRVKVKEFRVKNDLTKYDLKKSKEIIDNIPIWDWKPLNQTFKQLQEMRLYYNFSDIGIDRYYINNQLKQVMVAAREITYINLPKEARTWINKHLKYTHGYGIVMSYASSILSDGLPEFIVKDIPPVTLGSLKIERPEIYFGTFMRDYVIVNTKIKEFDYPAGGKNVYTFYKGDGGIKINSFFKKFIFSFYLGNIKILLSDFITNSSRVILNRNIIEIVKKIAPFFVYDNKPYIIIANGKLYWIIDGYTKSKNFPYSEKYDKDTNYIRNSIKVIIDAYTGKVTFVLIDKEEPIIKTYRKIFPEIFKDIEEIDEEIIKHFKYPQDIFLIQAEIYSAYHMDNVDVFYNKEDLWELPLQVYDENEVMMTGYYILNNIEGELEFFYTVPFTPVGKQNMIALMMVRCDYKNYGEFIIYKFPKKFLTYGPMQIEARIDQSSEISKLITLWSQKGSKVIRGDLIVVPIKNSLIYIEPLYLQAERQELPELKRVIVAYKDRIVIAPTLQEALLNAIENKKSLYSSDFSFFIDEALYILNKSLDSIKKGETKKVEIELNKLKDLIINSIGKISKE